MRELSRSSYRVMGEDGVENSGDRASSDVLVTIVPWHGRTTPLSALGSKGNNQKY